MTGTILVLRGLPGSGKSTFAHEWVAEDPDRRARVNRDDIRHQLFGRYTAVDELAVTKVEEAQVAALLKSGKDVVIDAMHLKLAYVKRWAKFGEVEVKDFAVPVDWCIAHDEARTRQVGAEVIRSIAKRYHIPTDGTLPEIPAGALLANGGRVFRPYEPGDIFTYSFDIDGTLARHEGIRDPYDTSRYHLDRLDSNVATVFFALEEVLENYYGAEERGKKWAMIGLSGRNEDYRAETEAWLKKKRIHLDALFMRPSDQPKVNDAIIKSDLVDKYISGAYNVVMHFDDRNRVVDALRSKGMKVAQVEPGNF